MYTPLYMPAKLPVAYKEYNFKFLFILLTKTNVYYYIIVQWELVSLSQRAWGQLPLLPLINPPQLRLQSCKWQWTCIPCKLYMDMQQSYYCYIWFADEVGRTHDLVG